jgi:hypothetical protein
VINAIASNLPRHGEASAGEGVVKRFGESFAHPEAVRYSGGSVRAMLG